MPVHPLSISSMPCAAIYIGLRRPLAVPPLGRVRPSPQKPSSGFPAGGDLPNNVRE